MADDQTNNTDLGAQGVGDQIKGKAKEATGAVEKKAGQVTGDTSTEAKGMARETEGKVQSKKGDVERKADDILNNNP